MLPVEMFLQIAAGVDDDAWLFHLRRADYSRWFREAINDQQLTEETAAVEQRPGEDAAAGRAAIHKLVNRRYTAPSESQSQ